MRQSPEAAELVDADRDAPARDTRDSPGGDQGGDPGGTRPEAARFGAVARRASRLRWSTRKHLIFLVSAVLVPMLAFAGILLWHVAEVERRGLQEDAVSLADTLAGSVDRQLQGFTWVLQVLASSPALDRGETDVLYRHAEAIKGILNAEILIKDVSGQQLVNTHAGPSGPLPGSLSAADREAIATKRPVVSDLFVSKTARRLIVSIVVPVIRDGDAVGLVVAWVDPERLGAVLGQTELPRDWLVSIVDGADLIVARTRKPEESSAPSPARICARMPRNGGASGSAPRSRAGQCWGPMHDLRSPTGGSRSACRSR